MSIKTKLLTFHRLWGHTIIIAIAIAIVSGWQRGLAFAWAVILLDSLLNAISAGFQTEDAEPTDSDEVTLKLSSDNCNELIWLCFCINHINRIIPHILASVN